MNVENDFNSLLKERDVLIIDGGLATALEAQGSDLNHPLWSGELLQHEHSDVLIRVHEAFLLAGADVIITASYQASTPGLVEHFNITENDAATMIQKSVVVAKQAREIVENGSSKYSKRKHLIAGSIGPYGAYLSDGSEYRGDYDIPKSKLKDFHRGRIQALIDGGVDLLALETMPNIKEIEALLELLETEFPAAIAWLSCTLCNSSHISDGTRIEDVVEMVNHMSSQIVAFGINCVAPRLVEEFLLNISPLTSIPLLCYPNSGEHFDAVSKSWLEKVDKVVFGPVPVERWIAAGAKLIGGCCRTSDRDVRTLASLLEARK